MAYIPPKRTGRPAKYDLGNAEASRFVRCPKETRESIRTGYLTRARVTGVKITTRAVKGGLMIYKCTCTMAQRMVGDGCEICNPEMAREIERGNVKCLEVGHASI